MPLSDSTRRWTAEVGELLGLPGVGPQVARRLTDKDAQRSALRAGGVPVPGFWQVPDDGDEDGWRVLSRDARFPAVLKPRQGDSGRDVLAVGSLGDVRSIVADRAHDSRRPQWMLEEYLRDRPPAAAGPFADVVSVESIVAGGRVSHLAITGRFPFAEPFRETGSFMPSALDGDDCDAVLSAAGAAIAALGIGVGAQHTEIKLTPDGPRVIEVNGRVGAGVPDLLAAVTGVNVLAIAMRVALGEPIAFDEMPRCDGVAYVLLPQAPRWMTRITAVDGLDRIRADPRVQRAILRRAPGERLDLGDGFWDHVFSVEGVVADHDELAAIARRVASEVRISGE
jgi:biotin carboxylase